jgi:N-acetylglutamate synthase-like GNAT family acetyltransferase
VNGQRSGSGSVSIRAMRDSDVDAADLVMRNAFGTFWGLAEPHLAFGDAQLMRTRFAANPDSAFVAERDEEIVGAVLATRWGSSASMGPLVVRPDLWDQGIAHQLLEPINDVIDAWDVNLAGLFTFANSPKHVGLYQRFGYWPQHLNAIMTHDSAPAPSSENVSRFSALSARERSAALDDAATLTSRVHDGLDLASEVSAIADLGVGDTVLVRHDGELVGLALCYNGAGESVSSTCLVKFAAVAPSARAEADFDALLRGVESLAADAGVATVAAGVSTSRRRAYRALTARGYRSSTLGVRMHRPDQVGYCREDDFVIDDLR